MDCVGGDAGSLRGRDVSARVCCSAGMVGVWRTLLNELMERQVLGDGVCSPIPPTLVPDDLAARPIRSSPLLLEDLSFLLRSLLQAMIDNGREFLRWQYSSCVEVNFSLFWR